MVLVIVASRAAGADGRRREAQAEGLVGFEEAFGQPPAVWEGEREVIVAVCVIRHEMHVIGGEDARANVVATCIQSSAQQFDFLVLISSSDGIQGRKGRRFAAALGIHGCWRKICGGGWANKETCVGICPRWRTPCHVRAWYHRD